MPRDFANADWFHPSRSPAEGGVEVAVAPGVVGVRNSNNPHGDVLEFTPAEWTAFIEGARAGEFDLEEAGVRHP
jgi:hypothetical protein